MTRRVAGSRRRFCLGALSLGCAPLVGAILRSSARAAEGAVEPGTPRRFVGIYAPHGMAKELWVPGPDFDLGYEHCSLQPFDDPATYGQSFRERLVVVEGIDLSAGIALGTVGHDGARVLLTGGAANARSASIDQYLALDRGLGMQTPYSSLVLGIGDRSASIGACISYDAAGRPLPKRIDPVEVYDAVFAPLVAPLDARAAERFRAERRDQKSALDALAEQVRSLSTRVPAHLASGLDQHLTAHRELERRLAHFETTTCTPPPRPARFARVETANGGARDVDAITDLMVDLLAHSLACDLTRFSTLFLADLSRTRLYEDVPDDIHFGVSHRYRGRFPGTPGRPETWLPLARQNHYSHQKVARLMMRLEEHGLLDETLVYVSSDMGDPSRHSSRSVPTLLAGGGLKGGRHLRIESGQHPANNHLLVSICRAFGARVDAFGESRDPAVTHGALPGLWG